MMESGDQSLWIVKYHFVLFFPTVIKQRTKVVAEVY